MNIGQHLHQVGTYCFYTSKHIAANIIAQQMLVIISDEEERCTY